MNITIPRTITLPLQMATPHESRASIAANDPIHYLDATKRRNFVQPFVPRHRTPFLALEYLELILEFARTLHRSLGTVHDGVA